MSKKAAPFIVTGAVMMLFGITMVIVGTINNFLTEEYKADKLFIGFCAAVLAFGILAGTLLFGPLADRLGYKPLILAGILLVGAGLFSITITPTLTAIPYLFFVTGTGGGILNGVTNLVVARLFPNNSSAWLSLLGVFYALGALGLPLVTSLLLESGFSYRTILTWVSLSLSVPLLLVILQKFPEPQLSKVLPPTAYGKLIKHRAILLIGFFLFFQSGIEMIVPVWTPTYLMEAFDTAYDKALYAITIGALGMMMARLLLTRILKHENIVKVLFTSLLLTVAGILLLRTGGTFYTGLAGVAFISIGLAASFPVMLGLTATFFPHNSGTAFSMVLSISLIGNMLLNALTGYLLERLGTGSLIPVMLAFTITMILILWVIHYKLLKKKSYVGKAMVE